LGFGVSVFGVQCSGGNQHEEIASHALKGHHSSAQGGALWTRSAPNIIFRAVGTEFVDLAFANWFVLVYIGSMRNMKTISAFMVVAVCLLTGGSALAEEKSKPTPATVFGRIQYVTAFPDAKVKVVKSFADLRVQVVKAFADEPGKWEIVTSSPDFKVQIVDAFEDFTIEYVHAFPGVKN